MKANNTTKGRDWYSEKKHIKDTYNLRHLPDMFNTLQAAINWAEGCTYQKRVILGDNGLFWLVCPQDARLLIAAGYEYAI